MNADMDATATKLEHTNLLRLVEGRVAQIVQIFPTRGLAKVAGELRDTVARAPQSCEEILRPYLLIRGSVAALVLLMMGAIAYELAQLEFQSDDGWEVLSGVEAGINTLVFVGVAVVFLVSLELRVRRHRTFKALQELRALAHVLDMHQMDKARLLLKGSDDELDDSLSPDLLVRYLDDTADLLSVLGKLAAWYAQQINDGEVLVVVNEIEQLTTGLTAQIGQKILLVSQQCPEAFSLEGAAD